MNAKCKAETYLYNGQPHTVGDLVLVLGWCAKTVRRRIKEMPLNVALTPKPGFVRGLVRDADQRDLEITLMSVWLQASKAPLHDKARAWLQAANTMYAIKQIFNHDKERGSDCWMLYCIADGFAADYRMRVAA